MTTVTAIEMAQNKHNVMRGGDMNTYFTVLKGKFEYFERETANMKGEGEGGDIPVQHTTKMHFHRAKLYKVVK
jgi:hypothetical protein